MSHFKLLLWKLINDQGFPQVLKKAFIFLRVVFWVNESRFSAGKLHVCLLMQKFSTVNDMTVWFFRSIWKWLQHVSYSNLIKIPFNALFYSAHIFHTSVISEVYSNLRKGIYMIIIPFITYKSCNQQNDRNFLCLHSLSFWKSYWIFPFSEM